MPSKLKKSNKRSHPRWKPFLVHGKFEQGGTVIIESWAGLARNMPTALRRAALEFWTRKDVRWRHNHLAVLSVQALTQDDYEAWSCFGSSKRRAK